MNGRHFSRSSEIAHLVAEAHRMNKQDLLDTYGIEILENGQVFDVSFEETYKNLIDWADACVEQDEYDELDDKYGKYDDEDAG